MSPKKLFRLSNKILLRSKKRPWPTHMAREETSLRRNIFYSLLVHNVVFGEDTDHGAGDVAAKEYFLFATGS